MEKKVKKLHVDSNENSTQHLKPNEDVCTRRDSDHCSDHDSEHISFEEEKQEERLNEDVDFSVPELSDLKKALSLKQTRDALDILKRFPSLAKLPMYNLFGTYLAVWEENKETFAFLKEAHKNHGADEINAMEAKAFVIINNNSFDQLLKDENDCRSILTEMVVYRALDFNVREIFGHGLAHNAQIKLRRSDVVTLIKYRHFEEMQLTFNQSIKRGLVDLFYSRHNIIEEEGFYQKYCLAFYLEIMITEGYNNKEVLEYTEKMVQPSDSEQLLHVFIRRDQLDLFQWMARDGAYKFTIQHLGFALRYEAINIVMYMFFYYQSEVNKHHDMIPVYIIQAFQQSNQFNYQKLMLVERFFKAFRVEHFEQLLNLASSRYGAQVEANNPFFYSLNPLALGIFQIHMLRMIAEKFKSLEVKCIDIEKFLQQALLKLLDSVTDDEKMNFMLLGDFYHGHNSLQLLSQLKLYEIIQHRNVQEVINVVHRSEYSVEASPLDSFSVFRIFKKEPTFQDQDYEVGYRFYNAHWDRANAKQDALMFHIWKKSSFARYNVEFFTVTLFTLLFEFAAIVFISEVSDGAMGIVTLQEIPQSALVPVDPFIMSLVYQSCTSIQTVSMPVYYSFRTVEMCFFIQCFFIYKLLVERKFIGLTKRKRSWFTGQNIIMTLLGISGVLYVAYFFTLKSEASPSADRCKQLIGVSDEEYSVYKYVESSLAHQTFVEVMVTIDILLLWTLLILYMRQFQKIGTLIKVMFKMVGDFLKIMVIFFFMTAVFMYAGFILFLNTEEFKSQTLTVQMLFGATLGTFNFHMFDSEGDSGIDFEPLIETRLLGQLYLVVWLVVSNIMLLNLMIALFSDTYSRLQNVGDGLYLIEVIEMSPEKQYDKYYSGLICCPFPFTILMFPFNIAFTFLQKSERYNALVLKICHLISTVCILLPAIIISSPILLTGSYLKCLLNKFVLTFKKQPCSDRTSKIIEFFVFLVFGPLSFFITTIADFGKSVYLSSKPEHQLQLRSQKDEVEMDFRNVEFVMGIFYQQQRVQKYQKTRSKIVIMELREKMKVIRQISELINGTGNNQKIMCNFKLFNKIKQFILDNSILENGELFIYPQMIRAIVEDIKVQENIKKFQLDLVEKKGPSINQVHNQQQREKQLQKENLRVFSLLFYSQIRHVYDSFLEQKGLALEEQQLQFAYQTIDKTIEFIDPYMRNKLDHLKKSYEKSR